MRGNYRFFEWVNRHARPVGAAVVIIALTLGVTASMVANTDDADFEPAGEVFDLRDRAQETLNSHSTIASAAFIVEAADGGDVLTADAFREWAKATDRIRSHPEHSSHLVTQFDPDLGSEVPGVLSVVDLVEAQLPSGLETATDADVKAALTEVLDPSSPSSGMRFTLSELATYSGSNPVAPAFLTQITYDTATFESYIDSELWLREVQSDLREGAAHTSSIGLAIDWDQTFEEALQASTPFIFLAVALIVLLVSAVHRSYWSAVLVMSGLGLTMLAYNGVAALAGLKMGSVLLAFIVPIAMISFGVDFFIHGSGRVREVQVDGGATRDRAYPTGMTAVFIAMLLAATSSVVAFLSNASSGTEAIVQFGIGAGIALVLAYLILGLGAPRVLVGIEATVGPNPVKGRSRIIYGLALLPVAIVAGLAVTLAVVEPQTGAIAVAVVMVLFVTLPLLLTRRRNRRAAARGRSVTDSVAGAAHGLRTAGSVVHRLASRRIITVPAVLVVGAIGLFFALRVQSGFELKDFLSTNTGVVQSIDRFRTHFPSNGEGSSFIYVEGDLTDPATLASLDRVVEQLDGSRAEFGRYPNGELIVEPYATEAVRMTLASSAAIAEIGAMDVEITDQDANGLPDTTDQVVAIYDYLVANGVPTPDGGLAYSADDVAGFLAHDGDVQATALVVQIGSFSDGAVIRPAQAAMEAAVTTLRSAAPHLQTVGVTGDVVAEFELLESFRNSMLLALPLAVALTLMVAAVLLRSIRYAVASVIPIGFVVVGLYAFMTVAGFTINVLTATIAAIAVGVGIDFSTHFTARFREEIQDRPNRLEALRRAGQGTGGALVLSALTSVLGFTVMALAPTPIFATFGILTATMIGLSLVAALVVLPSVLLLVTREPEASLPVPEERELVAVG
ncbi:MAG: MMPL family transporter [Acidimicrobiia bacterium]